MMMANWATCAENVRGERSTMAENEQRAGRRRRNTAVLAGLALAGVVAQYVFLGHYGYFRDELYYLICSRHLDWGYVDQPPLSILVLRLTRMLFGDSLYAIRLPAVLCFASVVFLTGRLAARMGAGRAGQALAAVSVLVAPVFLAVGSFFSMNAIDQVLWVLAAHVLVRIVQGGDRRLWLLFGLVAGLGLQNKMSMLFLGAAVAVAILATPLRKDLKSPWLWLGGGLALLLFLPNLAWQATHGWASFEFMRNAALYKNTYAPPHLFVRNQILLMHPVSMLVWLPGVVYGFAGKDGKQYRIFSMVFVFLVVFFALTNGKTYYLAPAYPMVLALGGLAWTRFQNRPLRPFGWLPKGAAPALLALLLLGGAALAPMALPILPPAQFFRYQAALGIAPPAEEQGQTNLAMPQHFADRFGWPELAAFTAEHYRQLREADRARCVVFCSDYGRASAVSFFGEPLGLPQAYAGHNNYYFWGPPPEDTQVVLALHNDSGREALEAAFESVEVVGRFDHPHAMPYMHGSPLFLCRGPKQPLAVLWAQVRFFI